MNFYYPGYQAYNRTTSNNIVLTKIYFEKIQAKDLALLPAERKQPQIDKQIKILHLLEKKQESYEHVFFSIIIPLYLYRCPDGITVFLLLFIQLSNNDIAIRASPLSQMQ